MIADYKRYYGSVFAELIINLRYPLIIEQLRVSGRLASYVLNNRAGLQIKHATQRLTPWNFAFTKQNLIDYEILLEKCEKVFAVFVCETHGMVCIDMNELMLIISPTLSDQAWIRIERKKGKQFCIHGAKGELASKKPNGLNDLIFFLEPDS